MGLMRIARRLVPTLDGPGVVPLESRQLLSASFRPAPIDGDRAFGYLLRIVALGPRPGGSEAAGAQRRMVARHFAERGALVREQPFPAVDPRTGAPVELVNLIGSWHPERSRRVLIAAHSDTRPYADADPDPSLRREPYLGANDGASGVAVLMAVADRLASLPTPWGVDLVLFDGEELVVDGEGSYFLGSTAFARSYAEGLASGAGTARYDAALVLDMIGVADLTIEVEPNSLRLAPRLVREVWATARRVRAPAFRSRQGPAVLDDHIPLNAAGIPAIDLIDFDDPAWHTTHDRPERTSGASLAQVGRVVTAWLVGHRAARAWPGRT
jgi:glutaminyl-peptide cyclotransferase